MEQKIVNQHLGNYDQEQGFEEVQKLYSSQKSSYSNLLYTSQLSSSINLYERDQNEIKELLDLSLLETYLDNGEDAVKLAKKQEGAILLGPTGAGKSTTLHYFMGIEMTQETKTIQQNDGVRQKVDKQVIVPSEIIDGVNIGYSNVPETQFLNVIKLKESQFNKNILIDSPGFKDKRRLEIDISNNLNTIKVLKACKSVRFILLINYHDLMADRGFPFIDTATIASRILDGKDFENNLKSLSVFFTHANQVKIEDIQNSIGDIQLSLGKLEAIELSDRQRLAKFVTYLLNQIKEKKSCILNPLDSSKRKGILKMIFSNPGLLKPDENLSNFSFSQESSSKIQEFQNSIKTKIEEYANQQKFKETSFFMSQLYQLYNLIVDQDLKDLYQKLQEKIMNGYKNMIDEQIKTVIEGLKNGNRILSHQVNELSKIKHSLCDWQEEKATSFEDSEVDIDYLNNQFSEKLIDVLNEINSIEKFIRMYSKFIVLKDILGNFDEIQSLFNSKIKILMDDHLQKGSKVIDEIEQKINNKQSQSGNQIILDLLLILKSIQSQEEQLKSYNLIEQLNYTNQLITMFNLILPKFNPLQLFIEEVYKGLDPNIELFKLEKNCNTFGEKINEYGHLYQFISSFSSNITLCEYSPQIMIVKNNIDNIAKQIKLRFYELFSERIKKLNSQYLKQAFIKFITSFNDIFIISDYSVQKLQKSFADKIDGMIKNAESKTKQFLKDLKSFRNQNNNHSVNDKLEDQSHPQSKTVLEKLGKTISILESIKWIDSYIGNGVIKFMVEYFIEKIEKISNYFLNQILKLIQLYQNNNDLTKKREICEELAKYYNLFCLINIQFNEMLPQMKDNKDKIVKNLQESFENIQTQLSNNINFLTSTDTCSLFQLFEIEESLICIEHLPKEVWGKHITSTQLIDTFMKQFQLQLYRIPKNYDPLLDYTEEQFKKWSELLKQLEAITQNQNNLLLLVSKFQKTDQQMENILKQIQKLHKQLQKQYEHNIENHDYQQASVIAKTANKMSDSLSDFIQLDHFLLTHVMKKDIQIMIADIKNNINNIQINQEKMLKLKEFQENQQDFIMIEDFLSDLFKKQLTGLYLYVKSTKISENPQNVVETTLQSLKYFEDLLSKEFIESQLKQVLSDINIWQKREFKSNLNKSQIDSNNLEHIFKWYTFVFLSFEQYKVDISSITTFDDIFEDLMKEQVSFFIQRNEQTEQIEIHFLVSLIQRFKDFLNLFNNYNQTFEKLLSQYNFLKSYFVDKYQSKLNQLKFNNNNIPLDSNQQNGILVYLKNLEQLFSQYFEDKSKKQELQEIEQEISQKSQNNVHQIEHEFLCEQQSDDWNKKIIDEIQNLKKQDHQGFDQVVQLIVKINKDNNSHLERFINSKDKNVYDLLWYLHQAIKFSKLNQFCNDRNSFTETNHCVQLLINDFQVLLKNFDFNLKNSTVLVLEQREFNNFYEMKMALNLIQEYGLFKKKFEVQQLMENHNRLNNELFEIVRQAINSYEQQYLNSNYIGLQKSLILLKKIDSIIVYIRLCKDVKTPIPNYYEKKLIEIVLTSSISNYKQAEEKVSDLIGQIEQNLKRFYQNQDYSKFAYLLNNFKQLNIQNSQQSNANIDYHEIKKLYSEKIKDQINNLQENIINEKWDQQLSIKIDLYHEQEKELINTDLSYQLQNGKVSIHETLKMILEEKLKNFKVETSIENRGNLILDLRQICDCVPCFDNIVKTKISECLDYLIVDYENQLVSLSDYLYKIKSPFSDLIIQENKQFSHIYAKIFDSKTSTQHTPEYINSQLRVLDMETKDLVALPQEQQILLKKKYDEFQKQFKTVVEKYKQKQDYQDLIQSIKKFIKNKKGLTLGLDSWSKQSQDDCNILFSQICAYWTLSNFKQNIISNRIPQVQKKLHASQIFSIMILLGFESSATKTQSINLSLQNQFLQIPTGEGKSIILGILSLLLAIMGYKVDVVCYSKHLSERDYHDFKDIFEVFEVQDKVKYGTITEICNTQINSKGDLRELSQQLLQGNLNTMPEIKQEKTILLIDEVDVFFSGNFYGQTYNPIYIFQSEEIIKIFQTIWENRKLEQKQNILNIYSLNEFSTLVQKFPEMEHLFKFHITSMVQSASNIDSHQYIFKDGQIGYEINDTIETNTFEGYFTNFAYYQEMKRNNLTEEQIEYYCSMNLNCGYFSYFQLPKLYHKILGVTGTLDCLDKQYLEIIKNYAQKATIIPSMFGVTKLNEDICKYFDIAFDEPSFFLTIMKEAEKYILDGQPVLIFFKDNNTLTKFKNSQDMSSSEQQQKVLILNQQSKHTKTIIDQACRAGQLTLIERSFGRGTNFYCNNDEINKKGGVVVIQTYFSEEISEEIQIKGRTARQKNDGKFIQIIFSEDIQEQYNLKVDELKEYKTKKSTLYDFLNQKRVSQYSSTIEQLTKSVKKADILHDKTLQYTNCLLQNNKQEALKHLLQFNTGISQGSSSQFIHFIILLDESGSMSSRDNTTKSRWQRVIDAVSSFVQERQFNTQQEGDFVSVAYHGTTSRTVVKYEKISNLLNLLNQNPPNYGGNEFYLAIDETIKILDDETPEIKNLKKIIMFLSDGGDCSKNKELLSNSLNNLKTKYQNNILGFWNLGFGPGAEAGVLKEMTNIMKDCGGEYKTSMNLIELQQNFQDLAGLGNKIIMN